MRARRNVVVVVVVVVGLEVLRLSDSATELTDESLYYRLSLAQYDLVPSPIYSLGVGSTISKLAVLSAKVKRDPSLVSLLTLDTKRRDACLMNPIKFLRTCKRVERSCA